MNSINRVTPEERTKKHPSFFPPKLRRAAGVGSMQTLEPTAEEMQPLRGCRGKCEREAGSSGPRTEGVINPGGWGRVGEAIDLAHVTLGLIIWNLSARWIWVVRGLSPESNPVPRTMDSCLSPWSRRRAGAAPWHSISGAVKEALESRLPVPHGPAHAWERLTLLFSSGSFCRIVLAPVSKPLMGKTEGVPYLYYGACICVQRSLMFFFLVLFP